MKFKAFSLIALFIVPGLLIGCKTLPENSTLPENPEHRVTTFEVEIDSDPSGAVIEINDDYAGKTPLKVELEGWETTRTFVRNHKIVAHPFFNGGYLQQKYFSGWSKPDLSYGNKIPKKIYINMHLRPLPDKLDININKNK